MKKMTHAFFAFLKEEDGVTMVEYGLIAALVAVVAIAGAKTLGTNLNDTFDVIAGKILVST